MNNLAQTNAELAQQYYRIATLFSTSVEMGYTSLRRRIHFAKVNICDYYRQHGNLKDLPVNNIGVKARESKTIAILCSLLSEGFEATKEKVLENREVFFHPKVGKA